VIGVIAGRPCWRPAPCSRAQRAGSVRLLAPRHQTPRHRAPACRPDMQGIKDLQPGLKPWPGAQMVVLSETYAQIYERQAPTAARTARAAAA